MPPDADLSPPAVADLIADAIEALELDDVTLVGNDSGGAISQLVATRRPERIGALVLTSCDAFDNFPPKALRPLKPLLSSAALLRPLLAPARAGAVQRALFKTVRQAARRARRARLLRAAGDHQRGRAPRPRALRRGHGPEPLARGGRAAAGLRPARA